MPDRKLINFDASKLDAIWPEVSPMLAAALECGDGELDLSQLRMMVANRQAMLILVMENDRIVGVGAVEFIQYPNYRVANFIATGGKQMLISRQEIDQVRLFMKDMGASKMQGFCPDSVARLWERRGARKAYNLMRWDL
ncbi:hypothetical protein [Cupriavidus campinensis]|uniref:GNAT family N-acetyltransferase n=1 Tax=Cupriavidus campinensis TaxID=151783 RepID=A0ABY3EKJ2_9BURK|nr:hypothetical protein [Cupriavidus campinensis]TSP11436.1 hypothetical protein FGG12_17515 [Cupriavidus campinensis]